MGNIEAILSGVSTISVITVVLWVFKIKQDLKREIVDPDINLLRQELTMIKENISKSISDIKKDRDNLSEKIDRQFQTINNKLDKSSQETAKMLQENAKVQGMLSILLNQMQNNGLQ